MKSKSMIVFGCSCFLFLSIFSSTLRFAWEALKNPHQVGAIFECSESVGHELMRYIKQHKSPRTLIEIGAGMGAITQVICHNYLTKDDRLDVIEINPEYCVNLRKLFPRDRFPNVHIHCVDILKFKPTIKYDYIICTLPFNAFPNGLVKDLQKHLMELSHNGTYLSYVEYMFLGVVKLNLASLADSVKHRRMAEHKKLVDNFKNKYLLRTAKVFKNVPPIYIHHLQIND